MGHFRKQVIAHRVHAEHRNQIVGVNDVAARLRHFVLAEQKPRVAVNLFRERLAERHQHNRPVNRVETDNVLADDMHVGRPVFFIKVAAAVRVIAERGDIVGKRIDPDVNHVFRVKGDRNPPFKRGARDAKVLKTGFDEVIEHLFFARFGVNEVFVAFNKFFELFLIFGKAQEIGFLFRLLHRAVTVGAAAVFV